MGQGWASGAGPSAGAAEPGPHQGLELADAVFYQLLWKAAAILIASSSNLLSSAQLSWPRSAWWRTSGVWQGFHTAGPIGDTS